MEAKLNNNIKNLEDKLKKLEDKFKNLEFELKQAIHSMIRTEQIKINNCLKKNNDFIKEMKVAEFNRDWKSIKSHHILSTKINIKIIKKIKKTRVIPYYVRNETYYYQLNMLQPITQVIVPLKLNSEEILDIRTSIESNISLI